MNTKPFSEMELSPETRKAIEAFGFENATQIQYESIPLVKAGRDVIGRSQTGTGKTLAFGIPAVEMVDTGLRLKCSPQVLILCPTRELAVQAAEEIKKLAAFKPGVRTVCVFAAQDRLHRGGHPRPGHGPYAPQDPAAPGRQAHGARRGRRDAEHGL